MTYPQTAPKTRICNGCTKEYGVEFDSCPHCGLGKPVAVGNHPIASTTKQANVGHRYCGYCHQELSHDDWACPKCGASSAGRDKTTAAFLALFLGGVGGHKFYLGRPVQGVLYLFFCWTFIPSLVAGIEFFLLLLMNEARFTRTYNMLPTVKRR